MKKIRTSFFLTVILVSIFLLTFLIVNAAPDSTLYFNPSTDSVTVDEDFTLDAVIDPGVNHVSAVTLHFTFDQTKLRLDSVTPSAVFSLVLADAVINNTNGTASMDVAVPASNPSITTISTMVTLGFHALDSATDSSVTYTIASQVAADGEAGDVVLTKQVTLITIVSSLDDIEEDIDPPNKPSNFLALSAYNQIKLLWLNPSDLDFFRVKLFRKIGSVINNLEDPSVEVIYEGSGQDFADVDLNNQNIYYYGLVAFDENYNYSEIITLEAQPGVENMEQLSQTQTQQNNINNLYSKSHEIVEKISSDEAGSVYSNNQFVLLSEETLEVYEKLVKERDFNKIGNNDKYSIAYFIHNGTDTTLRLGAGERAGVINSFWEAFGKAPSTTEDWQDVIKIANGRWPKQISLNKEELAKQNHFRKIYKKDPSMDNTNDNAAVTIITYGLRPVNRNMDSEKAAIITFKAIYNYSPENASDWDIVRAVAYSGAKR